MTKKTYANKMLDPRWQKFRLKVYERYDFKCRHCGGGDQTLHAHHTYYQQGNVDPWDYEYQSVITLCSDCHEVEHGYLPVVNKMLMDAINSTGISWAHKASLITLFDLVRYKENLPENFWDVMMLAFESLDIYNQLLPEYKSENIETTSIIKNLRLDNYHLIVNHE